MEKTLINQKKKVQYPSLTDKQIDHCCFAPIDLDEPFNQASLGPLWNFHVGLFEHGAPPMKHVRMIDDQNHFSSIWFQLYPDIMVAFTPQIPVFVS